MDENTQNDLEAQLRKYIEFLNNPNKTAAEIEEQNEMLKGLLGVQKQDQILDYQKQSKDFNQRKAIETFETQLDRLTQEILEEIKEREEQEREEALKQQEQRDTVEKQEKDQERAEKEDVEDKEKTDVDKEDTEGKEKADAKKDGKGQAEDASGSTDEQEESFEHKMAELDELEEKAKEAIKTKEAIAANKNGLLEERVKDQSVLRERLNLEKEQDKLAIFMAEYIVYKTIEAERRELVARELQKEIENANNGKPNPTQLASLTEQLSSCDKRIDALDVKFTNEFSALQKGVVMAKEALSSAQKNVINTMSAEVKGKYEQLRTLRSYDEGGIMTKSVDELSITARGKDMQQVIRQTECDPAELLNDGPNYVTRARFLIDNHEVVVAKAEHTKGTDTSYQMNGRQVSNNDIGETGTVVATTDDNDLVRDNPSWRAINGALGVKEGNPIDNFDQAKAELIDRVKEKEDLRKQEEQEQENDGEINYYSPDNPETPRQKFF